MSSRRACKVRAHKEEGAQAFPSSSRSKQNGSQIVESPGGGDRNPERCRGALQRLDLFPKLKVVFQSPRPAYFGT